MTSMGEKRETMKAAVPITLVIIAIVCLYAATILKSFQDDSAMAQTTAEAFLHKLNVEYLKLSCDGTDCNYTDKHGNLNLLRALVHKYPLGGLSS